MEHTFKVGDRVRVRPHEDAPGHFNVGQELLITAVEAKEGYVWVNGSGGWLPERFELIDDSFAPGTLVYYKHPTLDTRVTGEVISYHELPWGKFVWCKWDVDPEYGYRDVGYVTIVEPEAEVKPVFNIGDTVVITEEAAFGNSADLKEFHGMLKVTFEIIAGPDAHGDYTLSHPDYPDVYVQEKDLGHVY